MAQEFVQEQYLNLHELQPLQRYYYHYDVNGGNNRSLGYEITAREGAVPEERAASQLECLSHPLSPVQPQHDHRSQGYETAIYEASVPGNLPPRLCVPARATRKRKSSSNEGNHSSLGYEMTACESSVPENNVAIQLECPSHSLSPVQPQDDHRSQGYESAIYEASVPGNLRPTLCVPARATRKRKSSSNGGNNHSLGYEITSCEGAAVPEERAASQLECLSHPLSPVQPQHDHRSQGYEAAICEVPLIGEHPSTLCVPDRATRIRKSSSISPGYEPIVCETKILESNGSLLCVPVCTTRYGKPMSNGSCSTFDDDYPEDTKLSKTEPTKRKNHSEIEKRRRDKMNTYITELSSLIPMCGTLARKLDKLTVLRMAVQHLRSIRGVLSAATARPRPSFLSDKELNGLILKAAADCFLLVVGCDRGRLIYVSTSVKQMLHYDQSDLLGQSMFDFLHPKDVAKVKEQLSSSDLSTRDRLVDAKTMLPVIADLSMSDSRLSPGARRSFFCRIKYKTPVPHQSSVIRPPLVKKEGDGKRRKHHMDKKYCVVQCTGYLKSWTPTEMGEDPSGPDDGKEDESRNCSCLVALGRPLPRIVPPPASVPSRKVQYSSRHAPDGRFLFVDQRVTLALGFLPQELLGTSMYEYLSGHELGSVARAHKAALLRRDSLKTPPYSFRRKDGTFATIQTHFKPFRNPWTKDVESLVANNTIVANSQDATQQEQQLNDMFKEESSAEMQRLINSHVESHKIGSAIAEEALRQSSSEYSPELSGDVLQEMVFNQTPPLADSVLDMGEYNQRNSVPFSADGDTGILAQVENDLPYSATSPPPLSPTLLPLGVDANGEEAMAVIMSLLEADAGLGGPVNLSGLPLPWPLP